MIFSNVRFPGLTRLMTMALASFMISFMGVSSALAATSVSINEGVAAPVDGIEYTQNRLLINYSGSMYCYSFGSPFPNTSVMFSAKSRNFTGSPFDLAGVTAFNFSADTVNSFRGRGALCPSDLTGLNPLLCGTTTTACLAADTNNAPAGDIQSVFRDGFESTSGSSVTVQSVTRPTSGSANLAITVRYTIPGSSSGTPALSYVSGLAYNDTVLSCFNAGNELFGSTSSTQVFTRSYNCTSIVGVPPTGTPLMTFMLFAEPGTTSYHPSFDAPNDNIVIVKM